uniref:Uncharacterized protein n=2 Tax=Timema TaxID=61471 RepID=A0A7R9INN4_9NEOP|nr:unnamed protein product [Timema tahoe]
MKDPRRRIRYERSKEKNPRLINQLPSTMQLRMIAVTTLVLLAVHLGESKLKIKPAKEYFNLCHMKDPELGDCIKNSIEALRPQLREGIPELNIVPLEPLNIPRLELQEGGGNFKFRQIISNLTIHGLGDFRIDSINSSLVTSDVCRRNKAESLTSLADILWLVQSSSLVTMDIDKLYMEMDLRTPSMMFTADYEMEGKILLIPLDGKGDCVYNFSEGDNVPRADVTTIAYVQGELVNRDGKEYMQVKDLRWTIEVKKAHSQFNNLFNGDKNLGTATNNFLNDNWEDAFKTYKHLPEEAFGVLFKDLINKVYGHFPFEELYLP